jgi:hypothetical protein
MTTTTPTRTGADPRLAIIVNLLVNVAAPLGLFYGLRAAGVDQWLALVLGATPPIAHAIYTVVVRRKVDALALFTLSILGLSVATSFIVGSPRLLLAKDGWMTAVAGLWILASLRGKPFLLQALLSLTKGEIHERAEANWTASPTFRRVMRVATVWWGAVLVGDALVRVVLAYSLPVDQVPLISTLQYIAVYLALEIGTRVYLLRRKVGDRVFAESGLPMLRRKQK